MNKNLLALFLFFVFIVGVNGKANSEPVSVPKVGESTTAAPSPLQEIIDVITGMEMKSDAKCLATANRLEDIMYGTPLSNAARYKKVWFQKKLIRHIFILATDNASKDKRDTITKADIDHVAKTILKYRIHPNGDLRISPANGVDLVFSERDFRHYSSIAYSLRAILGVRQDLTLENNTTIAPADASGIKAVQEFIDIISLAVLKRADALSRKKQSHEITEKVYEAAWLGFSSDSALVSLAKVWSDDVMTASGDATATVEGVDILNQIIDAKITTYIKYNKVDPEKKLSIFYRNIAKYYARRQMIGARVKQLDIIRTFDRKMIDFTANTLITAQDKARGADHLIIRAEDMDKASQELLPHTLNELEDTIFFPNLPKEKKISLEAYDMDSFRDFALHWVLLQRTVNAKGFSLEVPLDPFAAEVLVEAVAQRGVLLFRMAGAVAGKRDSEFLWPHHITEADDELQALVAENARTDKFSPMVAPIASTKTVSLVTTGASLFTDISAGSNVTFKHRDSNWISGLVRTQIEQGRIVPFHSGGGIAAEDLDNDGNVDLLLVGGGGNRLYFSDGKGNFTDVTDRAEIQLLHDDSWPGEARQPVIADFDNDGLADILITYVNDDHQLYKNLGNGKFKNVSKKANLGGKGFVAGPATAFDFDNDGLLDIYIGYFGNYVEGEKPINWDLKTGAPTETPEQREAKRKKGQSTPTLSRNAQNATPNQLFKNMGGMAFVDVSEGSGVDNAGWAQAVSHTDFNEDGLQDLILANDFGFNYIFQNIGGGKFKDISKEIFDERIALSSMNVGLADLNRDGHPDIYFSNISAMIKDDKYILPAEDTPMKFKQKSMATLRHKSTNRLYLSHAKGKSMDGLALSESVNRAAFAGWSWDAEFFDFDNDGDDDLYVVNGYNPYAYKSKHNIEDNVLFVNEDGELKYHPESGAGFKGSSRSAVYLDFDNDGDLDIVINNFRTTATLLRNETEKNGNEWIKIRLIGDTSKKVNRDAIGARLVGTTKSGGYIWREIHGGSGFFSTEPKTQHFGLGKDKEMDLTITWPNRDVLEIKGLKAGRTYTINQATGAADFGLQASAR